MADVMKTCANCGNVQAGGDFCEKCGARLSVVPPSSPSPPLSSAASPAAGPAVTMPPPPPPSAGPATASSGTSSEGPSSTSQYASASGGQVPPQYGAAPQYGASSQYGPAPQYGGGSSWGGGPGAPIGPGYGYPSQERGFFARLFDLSFEEFITPSIIKVLFIISIVVIGLGVLAMIITGFIAGPGPGVVALVSGLIGGFLAILYARVILELFIIFFRIHDNTESLAESKR